MDYTQNLQYIEKSPSHYHLNSVTLLKGASLCHLKFEFADSK